MMEDEEEEDLLNRNNKEIEGEKIGVDNAKDVIYIIDK